MSSTEEQVLLNKAANFSKHVCKAFDAFQAWIQDVRRYYEDERNNASSQMKSEDTQLPLRLLTYYEYCTRGVQQRLKGIFKAYKRSTGQQDGNDSGDEHEVFLSPHTSLKLALAFLQLCDLCERANIEFPREFGDEIMDQLEEAKTAFVEMDVFELSAIPDPVATDDMDTVDEPTTKKRKTA